MFAFFVKWGKALPITGLRSGLEIKPTRGPPVVLHLIKCLDCCLSKIQKATGCPKKKQVEFWKIQEISSLMRTETFYFLLRYKGSKLVALTIKYCIWAAKSTVIKFRAEFCLKGQKYPINTWGSLVAVGPLPGLQRSTLHTRPVCSSAWDGAAHGSGRSHCSPLVLHRGFSLIIL